MIITETGYPRADTQGNRVKGKIREISSRMAKARDNVMDFGLPMPSPTGLTSEQYAEKCADYNDVTLRSFLESEYSTTPEDVYCELGINPHTTTLERLLTLDDDSRWLVPEIFRDAIRLGMRLDPWYKDLVALSEPIAQPTLVMPYIEDTPTAEPESVLEAETIGTGVVTYGTKDVKISKVGVGIGMTYECLRYTNINLLSLFMQRIGTKLGHLLNGNLVTVLMNGDQADGSEAAAIIGVTTAGTLTYADIVRIWVRMGRLVTPVDNSVAGEAMVNTLLAIDEFKTPYAGSPQYPLVVKTPIPSSLNVYCHDNVTANRIIFLDKKQAIVQLTAAPLMVESEKIISKQIDQSFATITTGFANIFRDARVVLDSSIAYAANGFPARMDV